MIGYIDKVIRLLGLIFPKASRYVKTFIVRDGDIDNSNKLTSSHIDDDKT